VLALFALGVMSLAWMAIVAAAILVEKALPLGDDLAWTLGVFLVAVRVWVAASPATSPA